MHRQHRPGYPEMPKALYLAVAECLASTWIGNATSESDMASS